MRFDCKHLLAKFSIAACAGLMGCQATTVSNPLTAHLAASDTHVQMEFWAQLNDRPLVSHDEALHAILLYLDGHDFCASYPARYAELQKRGIVTSSISLDPDTALDTGEFATLLVRVLHDQGGLTMHLLGANPRLATRRLRYRGIFTEVSENQLVRGDAFEGILGKVDDIQAGGNVYVPAFMLPNGELSNDDMNTLVPGGGVTSAPSTQVANSTTQPAEPDVVINGIQGEFVEVRELTDQNWELARVGMHLGDSAEFRTGPHSSVRFIIEPNQEYRLDRMGLLRINDVLQGKVAKTSVSMNHGRVVYDLEPISTDGSGRYNAAETPIQHSTTIRSPNSTLAIRGTRVGLTDQAPYIPEAISLVGRAEFLNAYRQRLAFGTKKTTMVRVASNYSSAAETAQAESFVDPTISLARTPDDYALVLNLVSTGATVSIDRGDGLPIVSGGTPPNDMQLLSLLPGQYDFVLRWSGDTNLDLAVGNQSGKHGEFIFPAPGFIASPSGGRTAFNDIGGPHGGIEIVYWNRTPPAGLYSVGIANQGSNTAQAQVDVFSHKQTVQLFNPDTNSYLPRFSATVPPGGTAAVVVPVNFTIPVLPQAVTHSAEAHTGRSH